MNNEICEIFDNEVSVVELQSFIEQYNNQIVTYKEITEKFARYAKRDMEQSNGRAYNSSIGKIVWAKCLLTLKPFSPHNREEFDELQKCYKLLYYCCESGICPSATILWNFFGMSRNEFYNIIDNPNAILSDLYNWILHFFDMVATQNALCGNVNTNIKQWIDRSTERKIAIEEQLSAVVKKTELDQMKEMGENLLRRMLQDKVIGENEDN